MPMPPGIRRLCVAYDIEKYSARSNMGQLAAQERLACVIRRGCAASGLGDNDYQIQEQGDGGLALLPTGGEIDEPLLIATFIQSLDSGLREINRDLVASERIRLRVALHEGIVFTGAHGYAGDAVVDAFRMCEAAPVRRLLEENPDSPLVVVVSDGLHRGVLRHGDHGVPGDAFIRHPLQVKQFSETGWLYVPGGNAAAPAQTGPDGGTTPPENEKSDEPPSPTQPQDSFLGKTLESGKPYDSW